MMKIKFFILLCVLLCEINSKIYTSVSVNGKSDGNNVNLISPSPQQKVRIEYFYSCKCSVCRRFEPQFVQVVDRLHQYLDVDTIPTEAATVNGNGAVQFHCIHGSKECHTHKIHACALDILCNKTTAILYNACMMNNAQGTTCDDRGAAKCARSMGINFAPIQQCAYSQRGSNLLKVYVDKSEHVDSVPYVLVNGVESNYENFWSEVCSAFNNSPPPQCRNVQQIE